MGVVVGAAVYKNDNMKADFCFAWDPAAKKNIYVPVASVVGGDQKKLLTSAPPGNELVVICLCYVGDYYILTKQKEES